MQHNVDETQHFWRKMLLDVVGVMIADRELNKLCILTMLSVLVNTTL